MTLESSQSPEQKERESITDEQAQESYLAGDMEKFGEWRDQQMAKVEAYPGNSSYAQLFFEQKLARIQLAAGEVADAVERFKELAHRAWLEADSFAKQSFTDEAQERERLVRLQQMRDFEAACDYVIGGTDSSAR